MAEYVYEGGSQNGLIKDGDYEVILERMERVTIPSGKEKLTLMFRIRTDIEGQAFGNKCVFEDIWKEKNSPEHFNRKRINQLLGTQEIKEGTVFENINGIIDYMVGTCLIINVGTEFDDYSGEDKNKVKFYKSSKAKPKKLGGEPVKRKAEPVVIDDDDLPF